MCEKDDRYAKGRYRKGAGCLVAVRGGAGPVGTLDFAPKVAKGIAMHSLFMIGRPHPQQRDRHDCNEGTGGVPGDDRKLYTTLKETPVMHFAEGVLRRGVHNIGLKLSWAPVSR